MDYWLVSLAWLLQEKKKRERIKEGGTGPKPWMKFTTGRKEAKERSSGPHSGVGL